MLQAIADGFQYGFDIIDQTELPSGTVYPALGRLERDGLVKSAWENEQEAHADGRPARRYYKLTAPGVKALAEAAAFYRALLPAGKPRTVRGCSCCAGATSSFVRRRRWCRMTFAATGCASGAPSSPTAARAARLNERDAAHVAVRARPARSSTPPGCGGIAGEST